MEKIISYSSNAWKSINWKKLKEITIQETHSFLEKIDWKNLSDLHILGTHDGSLNEIYDQKYCYYSAHNKWLLILGVSDQISIAKYISRCSNNLVELDVRFTEIQSINLSHLTNIKKLHLSHNENLTNIEGLEKQSKLQKLEFKDTQVCLSLNLDCFPELRSLSARNTKISELCGDSKSPIGYLDLANTDVVKSDFLCKLPALKQLNLSGTKITDFPTDLFLKKIEILNVSNTPINSIFNTVACLELRNFNISNTNIDSLDQYLFPPNVRTIYLNNTKISKLPDSIGKLTNLRKLVVSDLSLVDLPDWLLDLKLEFVFDNGYGINLSNTLVKDINMDVFSQPRNVIEAWFSARRNVSKSEELRETKVVFLGDGGAGKSLTIQRLLMDGHCPKDFDGCATPGISITSRDYSVDDKNILVHYWDFGGQEILHSMHRMFLTKRTLYVVLINARDNTQDERARYWLHNVKSFANDSPIIMVLNQIDQNPSATVNETALRDLYPNLRKIVKLSAQNDSTEQFNNNLTMSILSEISLLPSVNEPFLPSWTLLKKRLQNMPQYYIDAADYNKLSVECGVDENEDVRTNLLDWFNDLGVSFCYRDSSLLSNYMILRPDWITNAIYIILFNGSDRVINGVIKHETIHNMLHPSESQKGLVKSVINDITYSTTETEYVLGVIRKFKLSYRLDDDTEFIPMLCDRNEKSVAREYVKDQNVLELHMVYDYLPNNVLHRLMVELRSQLEIENVWLTGAFFSQSSIGLSALVKTEDNTLKIYTKSTNYLYSANTYLGLIKNSIDRINKQMGLTAKCKIVYKENSKFDVFEYQYLVGSYEHGNKEIYSGIFNRNLSIENILKQSDRGVVEKKQQLLEDIINACKTMQNNKIYWTASEDERNTFIRDLLRTKGYYISDQTFGGKSGTGKKPGELDIEIRESADKPWAIYEALNIYGMKQADKNSINDHLKKVLDNYNPVGCPVLFLVSYLECKKVDFKDIWLKYADHIKEHAPDNYSVQSVNNSEESSFYIRNSECVYDCAGIPATVYHLCVRLGD